MKGFTKVSKCGWKLTNYSSVWLRSLWMEEELSIMDRGQSSLQCNTSTCSISCCTSVTASLIQHTKSKKHVTISIRLIEAVACQTCLFGTKEKPQEEFCWKIASQMNLERILFYWLILPGLHCSWSSDASLNINTEFKQCNTWFSKRVLKKTINS